MKSKHHFLLITIDCGRADHILGSEACVPNIDGLCRDGVRFNQAFCQANTTIPSLHSLFTSNYLAAHGLYSNTCSSPLPAESLPKILQKNGWKTAAFPGIHFVHYSLGQEFGNRFLLGKKLYHSAVNLSSRFSRLRRVLPLIRQDATALTKSALKWLERNALKKDCFLWIHFFDAHIPYYAPSRFIKEDIPDLEKLKRASTSLREQLAHRNLFNPLGQTPMAEIFYDIDYFPRLYNTALRYIDSELGYLFQNMKSKGLYDDTLIALTSDHGENLTEHGVYCHHRKLFDTTTHVPLILKDFDNQNAGTQVNGIVQHIDVAPTVLSRFRLPVPKKFWGKNLWPLIRGKKSSANDYAFCEHSHNYQKSIRTKDWQYIQSEKDPAQHISPVSPRGGIDEFPYNEPDFLLDRNDPSHRNVLKEYPDVAKKLSQHIEEIVKQCKEDNPFHEDLPESLKKQLESLGYL